MPVTIAILAGGRSSRMGADKALLPFAGIPMLQHVARTASPLASTLFILGRESPPDHWPADLPATFLPDPPRAADAPPAGPMPALAALLERCQSPILLLACDTPLLTTDTLRRLLAAHTSAPVLPRATLAVTQAPDGRTFAEPTLALYTPDILPTLRKLIAHGSFQPLLREPGVHTWPVPPDRRHELFNINTLEALAQAESIFRQKQL